MIRYSPILLLVAACSSSTAGEHLDLGITDEAGATDGGPTKVDAADASATADASTIATADGGTLEDALGSMGFDVALGALAFPPIDCCAAVTCFGNNPSSPYGEFFVPRGPGQTAANPAERADGTAPAWRLREDEALVYVGPTPPHLGYFGFTPYLFDRQNGAMRDNIFASLSDTLNDEIIHTASGAGAPFASRTAIVLAANATTRAKVHTSLTTGGVSETEINDLIIPESTVHLGFDDASDTVTVLMRVALFDSDAQRAAYLAAPGGVVYRVTPRATIIPAPEPAPADRPRGTGTNESARTADVAALHDAIVAAHPGLTAVELNDTALVPKPSECISTGQGCNGDNRDALYSAMTPFRLKDGDQLVVYGVDHHATAKATYSNISVYYLQKLYGVASIDSRAWPGTAEDYLPKDARAAGLFAWTIARHCPSGSMHCTEIPDGCPGVPVDSFAVVASRAYLEPATHTGPIGSELILDRAVLFRP